MILFKNRILKKINAGKYSFKNANDEIKNDKYFVLDLLEQIDKIKNNNEDSFYETVITKKLEF